MKKKALCISSVSTLAIGAASMIVAPVADAQSSAIDKKPELMLVDGNGVDLRSGELSTSAFKSTIGDVEDPTFFLTSLRAGSAAPSSTPFLGKVISITCTQLTSGYCSTTRRVEFNGYSKWFNRPTNLEGESLASEGAFIVLTLRDGTKMRFDPSRAPTKNPNAGENETARLVEILKPDGEIISYANFQPSGPQYLSSSKGFAIKLSESSDLNAGSSSAVASMYNLSKVYCSSAGVCSGSAVAWPSTAQYITNSAGVTTEKAVDSLGRTAIRTITRNGSFVNNNVIERDGRSFAFRHTIYQYNVGTTPYFFIPLTSFTKDSKTTSYNYNIQNITNLGVTVNYPNGETKTARFAGGSIFVKDGQGAESEANYYYAATAPGGSGIGGSPLSSLLSYFVFPEGNRVDYTYDGRGNVTLMKVTPKPGSPLQVLTSTAGYPASCTNYKICNQPDYVIDVRGNRTDFEYSPDHGGMTLKLEPADNAGVRARTTYEYDRKSAKVINSAGQLVAATPIWKLVREKTCRTASICTGSADERITSYDYDDNLLQTTVTVSSGDGAISQASSKRYDAIGNIVELDGTLPGIVDTTRQFFDANRNLVGIIGADPDGTGPLPSAASRLDLDETGRVLTKRTGTATAQTEGGLAAMMVTQTIAATYNDVGLKRDERVITDGVTRGLVQFSYDARNRLQCQVVRMNEESFSAAPADACTLGSPGPAGTDRISKTTYDAAGRVLQLRKAVGTKDEQVYATYAYSSNGQKTDVIDASGNRAKMTYDGFDRISAWFFPSEVKSTLFDSSTQANALATASAVSTSDYERYDYDQGGNRIGMRRRDGRYLSYNYDALNRLVSKIIPDGCAPIQKGGCPESSATRDVYYSYDLFGNQTTAKFDSLAGEGVSSYYNSLGQLTSSSMSMMNKIRNIEYDYNVDGSRRSVSFAGRSWSYKYDNVSRLTNIYEGASFQSLMSTMIHDDDGNVWKLNDVSGGQSVRSYSKLGTMLSQVDAFVGGEGGNTAALTYNPAGQITTLTNSNTSYQFADSYNVDRPYNVNGLNQYTQAGAIKFSHDANGNLVSDGRVAYVFDAENRLVSSSNGMTLVYDPLGRLFQINGPGSGSQFLYDGDQLSAEFENTGQVRAQYVHGPMSDDPILWYDNGSPKWLHRNHQGSVVGVAQSGGRISNINQYDLSGIPGKLNAGRFQFTGQAWLPEAGLYYYKARMYSPTLGRFLQTDPIGYSDSMNLYVYTGNDPVNGADPTGMYNCYSQDVCNAAERLRTSAVKAMDKLLQGNQLQQKLGGELQKDLKAFGTKNDGNNVDVRQGSGFSAVYNTETKRVNVEIDIRNTSANATAKFAHEIDHSRRHSELGSKGLGKNMVIETLGHMIAGAVQGALGYTGPDKMYWDYSRDALNLPNVQRGSFLSCQKAQKTAEREGNQVPSCN